MFLCSKIAWALNKGIKSEFKQYWDVELGVTYVPWSKVKMEDLDVFREGGMLDTDTLSPGNIQCTGIYINDINKLLLHCKILDIFAKLLLGEGH